MPARRNVLLVQLPIPPPGPEPIRGNVPLAAGYLKLMAQDRGLDRHYSIEILPAADANRLGDPARVEEIVARGPWLLGTDLLDDRLIAEAVGVIRGQDLDG